MKKVVLSGYYGFGNTGDEAILDSTVRALRKARPDLSISVLSKNPENTSRSYGVESHDRMSFPTVYDQIKNADLLIFGGGSLIQDATSLRSLLYYLGVIYLARLSKTPTVIYANGIGPLKTGIGRFLTRHALTKVKDITVRDEDSLKLIRKIGVKKPAKVTADPAFLLDMPSRHEVTKVLEENGLAASSPAQENSSTEKSAIVWISLRTQKTPSRFWDGTVNLVKDLQARKLEPAFLAMQEIDEKVALTLNESLTKSGLKPMKILSKLTPEMALGVLGRGRFCIGMRLHTLILSARALVPFLGIQVDPKIGAFCRALRCPVLPDPKTSHEVDLIQSFQALLRDEDEIRKDLSQNLRRLQDLARQNIQMVLDTLDRLT